MEGGRGGEGEGGSEGGRRRGREEEREGGREGGQLQVSCGTYVLVARRCARPWCLLMRAHVQCAHAGACMLEPQCSGCMCAASGGSRGVGADRGEGEGGHREVAA